MLVIAYFSALALLVVFCLVFAWVRRRREPPTRPTTAAPSPLLSLEDRRRQVLDEIESILRDRQVGGPFAPPGTAEFAEMLDRRRAACEALNRIRYESDGDLIHERPWRKGRYRGPKRDIGRRYEAYVRDHYQDAGYHVQEVGSVEGMKDQGRDLIATRGEETLVIQCKCWASSKPVRENTVCQLFGTAVAFQAVRRLDRVTARLVTHHPVSPEAAQFARVLAVDVENLSAPSSFFNDGPPPKTKRKQKRRDSPIHY